MSSDDMNEVIEALINNLIKPLQNDLAEVRKDLQLLATEHLRQSGELMAYRIAVTSMLSHPDRHMLTQILPESLAVVDTMYLNECLSDEQVHGFQSAQKTIADALNLGTHGAPPTSSALN